MCITLLDTCLYVVKRNLSSFKISFCFKGVGEVLRNKPVGVRRSEGSVNCSENDLLSNTKIVALMLVFLIHNPGLKERFFIVVSILIYPRTDLLKLLERSECLRLHVWKEFSRKVYFMKLRQGYINGRKKAQEKEEKRETREERRTTDKKRKIKKLAYSAEHRISIFYRGELDS